MEKGGQTNFDTICFRFTTPNIPTLQVHTLIYLFK